MDHHGEIRAVGQTNQRLKEATKLGFSQAILPPVPKGRRSTEPAVTAGIGHTEIEHLRDLVALIGLSENKQRRVAAAGNV